MNALIEEIFQYDETNFIRKPWRVGVREARALPAVACEGMGSK